MHPLWKSTILHTTWEGQFHLDMVKSLWQCFSLCKIRKVHFYVVKIVLNLVQKLCDLKTDTVPRLCSRLCWHRLPLSNGGLRFGTLGQQLLHELRLKYGQNTKSRIQRNIICSKHVTVRSDNVLNIWLPQLLFILWRPFLCHFIPFLMWQQPLAAPLWAQNPN